MPHTSRRHVLKRVGAAGSIGIAGLAGCSENSSNSGSNGGESDGPSSFTVGVMGPLSGPFAGWGQAEIAGAKLAKSDLESEFDVSINLVKGDTETDPSAGLKRIKSLVTRDNADFVQGGVSSAVCTKMGTWASDNGVSYIASGASDTLTGSACKKYMYSVYSSNTMQVQAAAPEMAKEADDWYVLYSDYTWGHTGQEVLTKALEENGASVVGNDAVPFPADDFTQYLNNVANSDVSGVALINPGLDARLAIKQLMNKGMHQDLKIMAHQFEDLVLWGLNKDAAAALDISPMGWYAGVEGADEFNERVSKQSKTDPFVRHYMGYTSLDQHVRAAIRAGAKDAESIRKELEGHEVSSSVADLQPGKCYWRACDHQLVQPVHTVTGRSVKKMQDDPYKLWFDIKSTTPGDKLARDCEATGCSL
jgi:branched-chain amino acid transport system substrate-binding protein